MSNAQEQLLRYLKGHISMEIKNGCPLKQVSEVLKKLAEHHLQYMEASEKVKGTNFKVEYL